MLPREIEEYYLRFDEAKRLSAHEGELERLRTQSILACELLPAPATIYDIGGGAGVHAFWLAERGYRVHLVDPVERHLDEARSRSGAQLVSIARGDARELQFPAGSADSVLLLGPLYHLLDRSDRLQALREVRRVLKHGGKLFAAGISRFASLMDGIASGAFSDAAFREIVARDLASGAHRNPTNHPFWFTDAYFHRPEELTEELRSAGFSEVKLLAVEGPVWTGVHFREVWADLGLRDKLLEFLADVEEEPSLVGASAHFLAIGQ